MDQFLGLVSRTSFLEIWLPAPTMSLSLFLPLPSSPFQAEFPSGVGRLAMSTYLSRLLRSIRERAQGGALSNIQTDASGLT